MSKAERTRREWNYVMRGLADSVITAPDKTILEELRDEGIDVVRTAADVRAKLLGAVRNHYQRRRADLRPATAPEKPSFMERLKAASIPPREVLKQAFARHPQALTAQGREEAELSDADVISMLTKLDRLGALDDLLP